MDVITRCYELLSCTAAALSRSVCIFSITHLSSNLKRSTPYLIEVVKGSLLDAVQQQAVLPKAFV